jgi:hypothetical protein
LRSEDFGVLLQAAASDGVARNLLRVRMERRHTGNTKAPRIGRNFGTTISNPKTVMTAVDA